MWYLATATFALVCGATDVLSASVGDVDTLTGATTDVSSASASVHVGDVDTLTGVITTRGGDADYFVDAPTTPVPASPAAGNSPLLAISCMSLNVSREAQKAVSKIVRARAHASLHINRWRPPDVAPCND
jgi:hypothetical protein